LSSSDFDHPSNDATEIAGELKDAYPNKNVTIVQGPDAIMNPTYNAKFRKTVAKGLTSRGVNIIYNDYIDNINSDGSAAGVVTRNNRRIDADLVVPTRGGRPNTAFLASSGFNLNSVGQVQVEKSFQVKGRRGVFAVGDITDIKEQKQAAKYGGHAAIVVPNVLAALEKREATKQYAGQPEVMIVSNGKNGGTGYMSMMGGITLGNWFAKMVKSKDLFVGMHRKEMGFTA
jgi:NADH dehydrogenase FAD-containing subunit